VVGEVEVDAEVRVDGVRGRRAIRDVVELGEVEDHLALFADDLLVGEVRDMPAVSVSEVLPVVHVVQSDRSRFAAVVAGVASFGIAPPSPSRAIPYASEASPRGGLPAITRRG